MSDRDRMHEGNQIFLWGHLESYVNGETDILPANTLEEWKYRATAERQRRNTARKEAARAKLRPIE